MRRRSDCQREWRRRCRPKTRGSFCQVRLCFNIFFRFFPLHLRDRDYCRLRFLVLLYSVYSVIVSKWNVQKLTTVTVSGSVFVSVQWDCIVAASWFSGISSTCQIWRNSKRFRTTLWSLPFQNPVRKSHSILFPGSFRWKFLHLCCQIRMDKLGSIIKLQIPYYPVMLSHFSPAPPPLYKQIMRCECNKPIKSKLTYRQSSNQPKGLRLIDWFCTFPGKLPDWYNSRLNAKVT